MNQHDHSVSSPPKKTKPYLENIQCHLKLCIGNHSEIHRSIELALDPGDFICNPSKVVAHVYDHSFYASAGR